MLGVLVVLVVLAFERDWFLGYVYCALLIQIMSGFFRSICTVMRRTRVFVDPENFAVRSWCP